jgi:hypothetical protein
MEEAVSCGEEDRATIRELGSMLCAATKAACELAQKLREIVSSEGVELNLSAETRDWVRAHDEQDTARRAAEEKRRAAERERDLRKANELLEQAAALRQRWGVRQ